MGCSERLQLPHTNTKESAAALLSGNPLAFDASKSPLPEELWGNVNKPAISFSVGFELHPLEVTQGRINVSLPLSLYVYSLMTTDTYVTFQESADSFY